MVKEERREYRVIQIHIHTYSVWYRMSAYIFIYLFASSSMCKAIPENCTICYDNHVAFIVVLHTKTVQFYLFNTNKMDINWFFRTIHKTHKMYEEKYGLLMKPTFQRKCNRQWVWTTKKTAIGKGRIFRIKLRLKSFNCKHWIFIKNSR